MIVVQAKFLSHIVDAVYLGERSLDQVAHWLALLLMVFLIRATLIWCSEVSANRLAVGVKTGLRSALAKHILALGPAYTHGEQSGELINVIDEGVESLDTYFSQYLPGLFLSALVPLIVLLFVFPVDWLSGMILLLTAPLIPLFMMLIGSAAQTLTRRRWQSLSRMSAYFLDVIQGLTTLKILGQSQAQIGVIAKVSERYREITMSVLRVTFLSALVLELVSTLSTAVVAVEIGLRLLYGRLSFEQAFFILLLAPEFYLPLRLLGTRFHAGMAGVSAAKRIYEILDLPTTDGDDERVPQEASETQDEISYQFINEICFQEVEFEYEKDRSALRGISFQLEPGQVFALVGPSGGGKSTIASLMMKFIQPTGGHITVDSRPIGLIDPSSWRTMVSWVPQNPYLFNDSVANNIRIARNRADMDQVIWAAEQAHAHEFIQHLPHGYETMIGEGGARLSSGQAQRIALARAFLKDAPLIILDEATAHLDPQVEALWQKSLSDLLEERTAMIIAHRMNTVTQADQILVIDQGRLIEQGTHRELLENGGFYKRLIQAYDNNTLLMESSQSKSNINAHPTLEIESDFSSDLTSISHAYKPEPAKAASRDSMSNFSRLINLMAPFKALVMLSALMGFATILSGIGLMATSAYIISAAARGPSIAELQVAIVGVRFFGITRGLFRYLERYLSHQATFRLLARLRVWFYKAMEPLAPARLMSFQSGDLYTRIVGDIHTLEGFYVRALAPPFVALLVCLAVFVFMSDFDVSFGVILSVFWLATGIVLPWTIRLSRKEVAGKFIEIRAALNAACVDLIQGMADLVSFHQGWRQVGRIEMLDSSLANTQRAIARLQGLQMAALNLLTNLGTWAVLVLAIMLVEDGAIPGVYLAVLILVTLTSFEAMMPLPQAALEMGENLAAAERLFELVDDKPEVRDPDTPRTFPKQFSLEVKDLSFRYPSEKPAEAYVDKRQELYGDKDWVLQELSFRLAPGKRLAIVGPNGAGKSTLVSLLLRFWEYKIGHIHLGGFELRDYSQDEMRSKIGVVSQRTYLFSASVRDNLRIANPKAKEADLFRAAQQAQIHDFIESLPLGYETWIGDQGVRLSAGERQRLAVARVMLKNAPFLILDEPTANLDAITERQVLAAIDGLRGCCATLLITHHLVGLEDMDEIIVLDNGRVVERGRQSQLLAAGGYYQRMWDIQRQTLLE